MEIFVSSEFCKQPLVSVCVLTYNQELYIAECLDSIVSQETSFDIEIVIGEDGGTDGTLLICKEYQQRYPEKIKVIHNQTNFGLMCNYQRVINVLRGKYVAVIGGDDYWCDIHKLQKQVDFLEHNKNYGVVLTAGYNLYNDGRKVPIASTYLPEVTTENAKEYAQYGPLGPAGSVMHLRSLLQYIDLDSIIEYGIYAEDYITHAIWSLYTNFGFMDDQTLVARVVNTSISHLKTKRYEKGVLNIRKYLNEYFHNDFPFDEEELEDADAYIELKYAFYKFEYKNAKGYKCLIKGDTYKNKSFYKYFNGPISFYLLAIVTRFIRKDIAYD